MGWGGVVLNSTDGTNWAITNLTHLDLLDVGFGNGVFVIASRYGAIYSSADGLSWTMRAPPIAADGGQHSVSFLNGRIVVNGQEIRSSLDGIEWTNHGLSPVVGRSVVFGAGRYLIPGYSYTMISTNLNHWSLHFLGNNFGELFTAAYGNGVFVISALDELYTSPNGTNVTDRYPVPYAGNVAFVNGRFFALGSTIETSVDGASWTRVAEGFYHSLWSIAHGNGIYVAVGDRGAMATSTDGQTWTHTFRGFADLRGIAYGNGRYVVVGQKEAWMSTDGEAWSSIDGPAADQPTAITWANGTFVVVGLKGELLISKEATTWTRIPLATNDLRAVIHDGTRFVAAGERTLVLSTNGSKWTQVAAPQLRAIWALGFGNGLYVTSPRVPLNGLRVSANAVDWEPVDGPPVASFAYGNNRFVGVASDSAAVSADGLTWDTYPIAPGFTFDSVVFANGMFVALDGFDGTIATSTNGREWLLHPTSAEFPQGKIFFANGALWMLGEDEAIIRSAWLQPAIRTRKTGTALELIVQAYAGQRYRLQRASVLGAWTDFQTFTPQTETTILIDNNTSATAFYRILSP